MEGVKFGFAAMKELKKSILYQTLEKCKSVFWFVFWFSSAINILALFLPLYTSQVLDRVLSSGSTSTLMMLSIVTVAALVCSSLLDVCRSLTMAKVADWIDREATPDLIIKAISLTSVKGSSASGEAVRDLGIVKGFLTGMGIFSLFDMPWAIVYLVAIFMIHPVTGMIAVVGIILLVCMAIWNELATKKIMQESSEENVRNIGYIDVASRNAEVVEAMGMIGHIVTEWSSRNDQNRELQIRAQSRSNAIMGVTKFSRSVLQIAVIGVGAWLAIHGHKTAGGIIAASILMGRALAPFEASINTWKMLLSARISYRRLQMLLLSAPRREQSMALPVPKGEVSMDRVFFTPYGGSKPTIKGVTFNVKPGTSVGIIGASASGKSTLVKLIVGVWKPISGVARLDGADVYTWAREDFGNHVGYLPQDVELFNASVKTNIARMVPNPDPEKVIKAAMIAGIHEMILQFPNGYDTIIGSGGIVLSGGQKQMIGLARAFYGDVRLLVLDEPNANLDGKAEAWLMKALVYAKQQGITTFVVTHKMQILSVVDQVIVMDDGMLSSIGDRDEILSRCTSKPPTPPQVTDATRHGPAPALRTSLPQAPVAGGTEGSNPTQQPVAMGNNPAPKGSPVVSASGVQAKVSTGSVDVSVRDSAVSKEKVTGKEVTQNVESTEVSWKQSAKTQQQQKQMSSNSTEEERRRSVAPGGKDSVQVGESRQAVSARNSNVSKGKAEEGNAVRETKGAPLSEKQSATIQQQPLQASSNSAEEIQSVAALRKHSDKPSAPKRGRPLTVKNPDSTGAKVKSGNAGQSTDSAGESTE
ncbi:vitamin B12 import ATP-binding protein BtuD [Anaplasma platys]|uniref:Vitamin B12 import ATP-binding protein BtuD n=2 Tax=Anaplasma platys TaxID=949 RepID=A0A858PXL5_9RICK|nr:vitamin B12 import ATP-binding protein BtuD [Anaplasma platys]